MNRNLNPHKEAYLAILVWGEEPAAQEGGGCMDFYESLSPERRALLETWVEQLEAMPRRIEMEQEAPSAEAGDQDSANADT
jgi:hypothetical protein